MIYRSIVQRKRTWTQD